MKCIYDFSRPRVRKDGKSLTKNSLVYELNLLCPDMNWKVGSYSYADLRVRLIKALCRS